MFRYNETSQVCSFIQNLLRSKNVPLIPILRNPKGLFSGGKIPKGFSYIHDGYFYLGQGDDGDPIRQSRYNFGEKYSNLTNNYIPTESYYSSELHEYLGEYLRAYRDTYRIDLMGLYNCFSNRLISKVSLPMEVREDTASDSNEKVTTFTTWYKFSAPNDSYKITCFPIKFNMEYKIKIYGAISGNITLQPIFYHRGDYLRLSFSQSDPIVFKPETAVYDNNLTYELKLAEALDKLTSEYELPAGEDRASFEKYLISNEKYLYLFVQVPKSQDLQISVIEEAEYFQIVNNTLLNLRVNYNVPFSDRLLEFLTDSVITPRDVIKQDITRVQTILMSDDFKKKYYRELLNSPLYTPGKSSTPESATSVEKDISSVLNGHYNKLKRFVNMTEEEKRNREGELTQVPPFNIIIPDSVEVKDKEANESDEPKYLAYYPTPGEYDDTMRVLLYSIFSGCSMPDNPDQKIPDFTGYVDKDVEFLLLRSVTSDSLKRQLMEV